MVCKQRIQNSDTRLGDAPGILVSGFLRVEESLVTDSYATGYQTVFWATAAPLLGFGQLLDICVA